MSDSSSRWRLQGTFHNALEKVARLCVCVKPVTAINNTKPILHFSCI